MASKGGHHTTCALWLVTEADITGADVIAFVASSGSSTGVRPLWPSVHGAHARDGPMPGGTYAVALRVRRCPLWEVSTPYAWRRALVTNSPPLTGLGSGLVVLTIM